LYATLDRLRFFWQLVLLLQNPNMSDVTTAPWSLLLARAASEHRIPEGDGTSIADLQCRGFQTMNQSLTLQALLYYGHRMPNHPRKWWLHDRLRNLLHVTPGGETEVVRGGLRWQIDPADPGQRDLYWFGARDYWDAYHIRKQLQPGSVILDIGANFGYYALTLAAALKRQCRVHAFEPNPPTHRRLVRNIELNGLMRIVRAHPVGLSDQAAAASMIDAPGNPSRARIGSIESGGGIRLVTLDAFCRAQSIQRVDFMKIDVEGFEERCLRGAEKTLARFKPMLCLELNPMFLGYQGSSVEAVVAILRRHGYRLYEARRHRLMPLEKLPSGPGYGYINAFCFHGDAAP
jgi:FkbM family methyltransferase